MKGRCSISFADLLQDQQDMTRNIFKIVAGHSTIDGAGVHLVRVLGNQTAHEFDPFLMLDAFDSTNPADYVKGFPMHPHRGIETFTYLIKGRIDHEDSLGNKGSIHNGESQWMTAGSGILHQEMPQPVEHLLGLQLWINLPANEKMTNPKYLGISDDMIKEIDEDGIQVKVITGEYKEHHATKGHHLDVTLLDVNIEPGKKFVFDSNPQNTLFVYLIEGSASFGESDQEVPYKNAVLFGAGDEFIATAGNHGVRFFLATAPPLHEPVAWGGPIVMNTQEELREAFNELKQGSFIKHPR